MANYNKFISLVSGGSTNSYFYRQNVISGDTLTVKVNNNHSGYNGWFAYVYTGSVTPSSHSNTSGLTYTYSPSTGIVFTVTGGTYYRIVFIFNLPQNVLSSLHNAVIMWTITAARKGAQIANRTCGLLRSPLLSSFFRPLL